MPKQQLSGTLDEQLATLYEMAQQRLAEGKYSGAVHFAKQIIKADPNYRDIQEILRKAQRAKSEQTWTLVASLVMAMLAIAFARPLGFSKDWQMLILGFFGLLIGFLLTTALFLRRSHQNPQT